MKKLTRSSALLAGGLALALTAMGTFAASPPADPNPASKGTPMEDMTPQKTPSTTPYSNPSTSTSNVSTSASGAQISMQSKFDSLDVNHDGYVDRQEAAGDQQLVKQFAKLEANKDSKLSITEFSNAKGLAMGNRNDSGKNLNKDKDRYKDQ